MLILCFSDCEVISVKEMLKKLTAVLLLGFMLSVALATALSNKKTRSDEENRELESFPKFTLSSVTDGSFFSGLESYASDHLFKRSKWLSVKSHISRETGENLVNGVFIGEDSLLDAEMSDREINGKAVEIINAFADSYKGTVYVAVIPTSSGVYGDKLPAYLLENPESRQISGLYGRISDDVRKIDAYNILKMLNDNYIYFRNDTKWTSYGAYCVYRTVIQKLGFLPTPYDKYTIMHITDKFRGNLYNRTLYTDTKSDLIDIYDYPNGEKVVSCVSSDKYGNKHEKELYDMKMAENGYMYDMYLGEPVPVIEIETTVNNEKKLLVIKDSYADCFIPFLTQHYNKITVVSPEFTDGKLSDYADINDYEQTLILFGIENVNSEKLFRDELLS